MTEFDDLPKYLPPETTTTAGEAQLPIMCENGCGTEGSVRLTIIRTLVQDDYSPSGWTLQSNQISYGGPSWSSPACLPGMSHRWQPMQE